MAEKAHSDMELRQRHERASKIREVVQVLFVRTPMCKYIHTRCTVTLRQAFEIQGQGMGPSVAFVLHLGMIFFVD